MTVDDQLEERLGREFHRNAADDVPPAPTIAELDAVVTGRRRRNRLATRVGAGVLVVGVIGGAIFASLPESSTDVVASAPESDESTVADPTDVETPGAVAAAPETEAAVADAGDTGDQARSVVSAPVEGAIETVQIPSGDATISVAQQESAVEFAGGSGVLITEVADGYAGIASRFGGAAGITAIGLESADGLNWSSSELVGVPAGATATALTSSEGTHIALFSQFDVDAQQNFTFVGTSTDLVEWTLAPALPGENAIATGIAAGPNGVIVVGVAPNPTVWAGPLGGPMARVGSIAAADTLAGVVATAAGFVAVGTSAETGATLFDSVDAAEWTASPMSSLGDADTVVSLSVMGRTIMLAGDDGDIGWTAMSSDGGQSWVRSELEAGMVSSVASNGSTIGFLGTSALGSSTVTLTDGESWSSTDLGISAPDRVELLLAGTDQAVLLGTVDGTLTWIVAER